HCASRHRLQLAEIVPQDFVEPRRPEDSDSLSLDLDESRIAQLRERGESVATPAPQASREGDPCGP
ncbi:MAG: hypothetical protein ABI318_14370, partial [Chthoniobacteraceae bacterium]